VVVEIIHHLGEVWASVI